MTIQHSIYFKLPTLGKNIAIAYIFSSLICNATDTVETKWKWGDSLPPSVIVVERYKDQKPQYGTTRLPGDDIGSVNERKNVEKDQKSTEKKRSTKESKE